MTTPKSQPRTAIYARYSSDMQSAASIADQVRLCRTFCAQQGYAPVEVFADEAISGATNLRPGYQDMIQVAILGRIDVVVTEALDRLSRDQEHIASFYKQMQFANVDIVTKSEGLISELHIGVGGMMNALFLKNLAQKTHRGLEGRVRDGKSAGGVSYGYRVVRTPFPDGTFTTGDVAIDPEEAAVVIHSDYAKGISSRKIAMALNAEGVPAPRGDAWSFSTISGNWKRGTGILNNELYIGKRVWNRQRFVKDPKTGKRQAMPNPPEAWITEDVPDLRIIDQDLWDATRQRQGAIRDSIIAARDSGPDAPRNERGRRARYLFSGVMGCADCGGN